MQNPTPQSPLGQSMWLPLTFRWFRRKSNPGEITRVVAEYQLLAACVSRNIPLPPLHLIKDEERHVALCLELGLEKGLRQLQRLAREHFPQDAVAQEKPMDSYNLKIPHQINFKEEEWTIFLHWLSRPRSPSYDMLKHGLRTDVPLVWEARLETKTQLNDAHCWLDDNFNRYVTALSPSPGTESSIDEVFALIYREQFELLWMFFFRSFSDYRGVLRDEIGAEIARCLFWRFDRSIEKAYRIIRKRSLTHEETKELWTKFLDWLTQGLFEGQARDIPSDVYTSWPRFLADEENSGDNAVNYCLKKIKYEGLFIVPDTQETPLERCMPTFPSHPQPQTLCVEPKLSELVQSEIWRRRLPERVFAFLFDDTETTPQPTQSDDGDLEELLTHGQPYNCGGPSVQGWRQEMESWKVVEQYISKSEWHMSCIKMYLLRGTKEEEDMYKEIVII
ncbi:hypothetical protein FNYG_07404 [Fusarium nygamai]|uniref:Uncharacterized protein n=1 Tax=Gibberella nygamai TaxID=42673 RepID=A0A2K0WAL8_GIBNY|nr:hypothetical protein FNYG_07404 [Fusarium nygamai]